MGIRKDQKRSERREKATFDIESTGGIQVERGFARNERQEMGRSKKWKRMVELWLLRRRPVRNIVEEMDGGPETEGGITCASGEIEKGGTFTS